MYRFRFSTRQNKEEAKPEKPIQRQTKVEPVNKVSNNPPKNIGYHSIRDSRYSVKSQISTNNNPINQIENVSTKDKNEDAKKFVKYSRYQSNRTSLQPHSETSKKPLELNKNENKEKTQQIPPAYKRRSYLITPKVNNLNENIKKDNKRSSSNEKKKEYEIIKDNKKEYEIIKDNKKEENNMTRRYIRRFNRDNKNENRNQEKKDDETDTTNSNLNTSNKNVTSFTKGRLLNDSNDKLISVENEKPPAKNKEIKEKDKEEIEPKKEIKDQNKGFKMRRFGKGNKTDDNLPKKPISLSRNRGDFNVENVDYKNKRRSLPLSLIPRDKNDQDNNALDDNKNFLEIKEVAENYESTIDNNNTKNSKDDKKISLHDENENEEKIENEKQEEKVEKEEEEKEEDLNLENNKHNEEDINLENNEKNEDINIKNGQNNEELDLNNNNENISQNIEEHKEKENEDKINNQNLNIEGKAEENDNNADNKEVKRNTLNREYIIMDNTFNEVEKFNAKKILKGDLAEIYEELIKTNLDFKDDIFFVNLNHFEKRVGDCDEKIIPHSFKEYKKNELFKEYKSSRELLQKYTNRAKRIRGENEFQKNY